MDGNPKLNNGITFLWQGASSKTVWEWNIIPLGRRGNGSIVSGYEYALIYILKYFLVSDENGRAVSDSRKVFASSVFHIHIEATIYKSPALSVPNYTKQSARM